MGSKAVDSGIRFTLSVLVAACLTIPGYPGGQALSNVTDHLGRRVRIPQRAHRILSLQPETTRITAALGASDRLVGIDYFIRYQDHISSLIFPHRDELPLVSFSSETLNTEMVIQLKPEVIFASPTEFHLTEAIQDKTGIPVLALSSQGRFPYLFEEIRLLGQILSREERAGRLVRILEDRIDEVGRRISGLSPEEKPRVYLAFWSSLNRTPLSYEPVDAAGGINIAGGLLPSRFARHQAVMNIEALLREDPDIILVQGNYPAAKRTLTVESILNDRRLQSLRAVREQRVFYTFGYWYWWDPAQVDLETMYLADLFHPGLFPGFDLVEEGDRIFEEVYGLHEGFTKLFRIIGPEGWFRRNMDE